MYQLSFIIIKVLFGTLSQLASQAITTLCAKRKGFKNKFFLTHQDMTDEVTDIGSRGLRKLCGEMDYDDWAMAAQARLGKRGLWDIITGPRPARRELAVSEDERELELKRRIAQRAFEQSHGQLVIRSIDSVSSTGQLLASRSEPLKLRRRSRSVGCVLVLTSL